MKRPSWFAASLGVDYISLEEVWIASDVISLHCPLTPENRHLVNADSLVAMKDRAILTREALPGGNGGRA